jgi:hypothetical protein
MSPTHMSTIMGKHRVRPANRLVRTIACLMAAGALVVSPNPTPAQSAPVTEYQLKAVFLFNFAQFVDWPPATFPDPHTPLVIGILGDDRFGSTLDETVRGEQVNDRPLVVQRYRRLDDVGTCQILFVSQSENDRLDQIVSALRGRNILTVSDAPDFALHGGMIQFVTDKNKIRLDINLDAAKAASLTISSKLLRPATIVSARSK